MGAATAGEHDSISPPYFYVIPVGLQMVVQLLHLPKVGPKTTGTRGGGPTTAHLKWGQQLLGLLETMVPYLHLWKTKQKLLRLLEKVVPLVYIWNPNN